MTTATTTLDGAEREALENLVAQTTYSLSDVLDDDTAEALAEGSRRLAVLADVRRILDGAEPSPPALAGARSLLETYLPMVLDHDGSVEAIEHAERLAGGYRSLLERGSEPQCAVCGEPAAFRMEGDASEERCPAHAREYGDRAHGHAEAAFYMLGMAAGLARNAGVTDAQLREAFHTILTEPHSTDEYPVGGECVLEGGWQRVWTPLAPPAAGS